MYRRENTTRSVEWEITKKRLNITYTAANSYRSLHSKLTSKGSKIQADKSLSEQATSHICNTKGGR